jgi:trehalose 6-phosphate synthase
MPKLIVVSNRVSTPAKNGGPSVGGLSMALADALSDTGGLWFGWSGETTSTFEPAPAVQKVSGMTIATIDLQAEDVSEYYNGFANTVLWPLFHHRIDLTHYERAFGDGYERVNARFADAIVPLVQEGDLIWIHDYHLIPLGQELRKRGVQNRIGFFLHIPWPARELMMTLPRHADLVRSLFAYDLVGFQCGDWLDAFKDYVVREAKGVHDVDGVLSAYGASLQTGVFPVGIDADHFRQIAASDVAAQSYMRAAATNAFRSMVIGVDRVDYAKGLPERFLAFERLLDTRPQLAERVSLLQVGQPSRGEVEAYGQIRDRLNALSGRINGKYATVDWTPIRYMNQSIGRDHLAGIYRAAKVGLVTPLRDGMNLVAKEYVAAQDPTDPGVLILSKFAGAAHQMSSALIVNPYSLEDVADAMERGLAMPLSERVERWADLMQGVQTDDAASWRDGFMKSLRSATNSYEVEVAANAA